MGNDFSSPASKEVHIEQPDSNVANLSELHNQFDEFFVDFTLGLWRGRRVCAVSPFFPFAFIFIVSFCLSVEAISMNLTINYLYQNRISNPETSYKFEKKHLIQNYLDHRQKI